MKENLLLANFLSLEEDDRYEMNKKIHLGAGSRG